jgi:hypothetical protein
VYSRKELELETVVNLREIAKEVGIKNVKKYKKDALIDLIVEATSVDEPAEEQVEEVVPTDTYKEEPDADVEEITEEERAARKLKYVEEAPIGTLVAFKPEVGKVKSAKIIKKSTKNRRLKVETAYGATFIVPYEDVIWVRSGSRWPRGVYNMLKGIEDGSDN